MRAEGGVIPTPVRIPGRGTSSLETAPPVALNRLVVAAAGAIALAILTGCGSSGWSDAIGPLGGPEASGSVCMTDLQGPVLTDGYPFVTDTSQTPAVIDRVAMANPRGLKLITAWAVPITGTTDYGAEPGYPPGTAYPKGEIPGFQWTERQNADGATVRHTTGAGHGTDLLFVVRLLAKRASASGVDIWYHVGSHRYHIRTVFGLIALASGSCAK
jgi:hypothetical protein